MIGLLRGRPGLRSDLWTWAPGDLCHPLCVSQGCCVLLSGLRPGRLVAGGCDGLLAVCGPVGSPVTGRPVSAGAGLAHDRAGAPLPFTDRLEASRGAGQLHMQGAQVPSGALSAVTVTSSSLSWGRGPHAEGTVLACWSTVHKAQFPEPCFPCPAPPGSGLLA